MATATVTQIDPIAPPRKRSWSSILLVLVVVLASAPFILWWRIDANLFPTRELDEIKTGMTKEEVLVILGEPNEHQRSADCWNYDRFHRGNDRICVRFDDLGKVKAVSQ